MTHHGQLSEDESKRIRTRIREIVDNEVIPLEPQFISRPFKEMVPLLAELRKKVRSEGLWAPAMPKELGGMGLSLLDFAHISEILGRTPVGHYVFNAQAPDIGNMEVLAQHGSEEQKQKYLLPLVNGDTRSCFSMTEPDFAGSNPILLGTSARRDGDEYVINGLKWFTSSAEGAAFAIVMAVTTPGAESPYMQASQIIVPTDTKGFRIVRNIPVMGEAGGDYASHAEVQYEDCRVPITNRIGEEGAGFLLAQERLGPGRIHHCMRWIGICERAFDLMCRRAVSREIAPSKPLATRQTVQEWIADSRVEIHASRLLVLDAAKAVDALGSHGAREQISMIKFYVANTLQRVLDRAIQVHGALGVTDDTPLAYWYRHERAAPIYDGPDEVHRGQVAKLVLRRYGMKRA